MMTLFFQHLASVVFPAHLIQLVHLGENLVFQIGSVLGERFCRRWRGGTDDPDGEKARVCRVCNTDGRDGNPALKTGSAESSVRIRQTYRHLHNTIQRIHTVQHTRLDGHPDDRHRRLGRDHPG